MHLCGIRSQADVDRLRVEIKRERDHWQAVISSREAMLGALDTLIAERDMTGGDRT